MTYSKTAMMENAINESIGIGKIPKTSMYFVEQGTPFTQGLALSGMTWYWSR